MNIYGNIVNKIFGIWFNIGIVLFVIFRDCVKLKNRVVFSVFSGFYFLKIIVVKVKKFCFVIVVFEKLLEIDIVKIVLLILVNIFEI